MYKSKFKKLNEKEINGIKIKDKGETRVPFGHKMDNHFALFYDGVLSGLAWFGVLTVCNYWDDIKKVYGNNSKVIREHPDSLFKNSKSTNLFIKTFGKEAEEAIQEAITFYNENN